MVTWFYNFIQSLVIRPLYITLNFYVLRKYKVMHGHVRVCLRILAHMPVFKFFRTTVFAVSDGHSGSRIKLVSRSPGKSTAQMNFIQKKNNLQDIIISKSNNIRNFQTIFLSNYSFIEWRTFTQTFLEINHSNQNTPCPWKWNLKSGRKIFPNKSRDSLKRN